MKVFKEEQRFTQSWLIMILIISMIVPLVLVLKEFMSSENQNANPYFELLVVMASIVLTFVIIFSLKLETRIDENGVYYRFFPFHLKKKIILWKDIYNAYVRKYNPISDYGGWGIKGGKLWNKSKGIAYNVTGDIGLQLELKNGKKILIGTQKENEVKRILKTYESKYKNDKI